MVYYLVLSAILVLFCRKDLKNLLSFTSGIYTATLIALLSD